MQSDRWSGVDWCDGGRNHGSSVLQRRETASQRAVASRCEALEFPSTYLIAVSGLPRVVIETP